MAKQIIQGRINYRLHTGKSNIHGTGAFAAQPIPAKKKIGTLSGEIISKRSARQKAGTMKAVSIVELWNGKALDATVYGNDLRYINHSCQPNTYMRNIGMQVEFYTLKPIKKEEELTCNYGETHHDGAVTCRCNAPGCKGYL